MQSSQECFWRASPETPLVNGSLFHARVLIPSKELRDRLRLFFAKPQHVSAGLAGLSEEEHDALAFQCSEPGTEGAVLLEYLVRMVNVILYTL